MANMCIGTYRNHYIYKYTEEEFKALTRRERNKVYLVNGYMILNDAIVGKFSGYNVSPAEAGVNIYDMFGIERPVVVKRNNKKRNEPPKEEPKVEVEGPASVDTLVE
jgi:hypothetical protein